MSSSTLNHFTHPEHPLILKYDLVIGEDDTCHICNKSVIGSPTYTCIVCESFYLHKTCAEFPEQINHHKHNTHPLVLLPRDDWFCDVCACEGLLFAYTCNTCNKMHRYFYRFCMICRKLIQNYCWLYYCHKCTYFVHVKCAKSPDDFFSMIFRNRIEADEIGKYPDLVVFPLPTEESLFKLIITQCSKLQDGFPGEPESVHTVSTIPDDPYIIKEHWSHENHPLEQLQFTTGVNDDDSRVLICDGCIQPITVSCPSYYTCMQCQFFLHSFCATKLPRELPTGACQFHTQHSLVLQQMYMFYSFRKCGVCGFSANGFYYKCEICDIRIEIHCTFLPTRIRHKSHKHHFLVQRP